MNYASEGGSGSSDVASMFGDVTTKCVPPPSEPVLTVTIWTVAACVCSLFCASFTIIAYLRLPRRHSNSYHFVFLLSLCDVSVALSQLTTRLVEQFRTEDYQLPTVECSFRGWFLFSTASRIMWNCCIASFLLLAVFLNTKSPCNPTFLSIFFHVSTWLVSIAVTASILALPVHSSSSASSSISSLEGCLSPQDPYYLYIWGLFILVAVLVNVLSYLVVIFKYWFTFRRCTRLHRSKPQIAVPIPFLISLYLLSFLVCWSVNVVEVIKRIQIGGAPCYGEYRTIAQAVLQNSQGVFDALTYYITSNHLRSRYTLKQKLVLLTLAPFLLLPALLWKLLHPIIRYLYLFMNRKARGSLAVKDDVVISKHLDRNDSNEEAHPINILRKSIANQTYPHLLQTYQSNEKHHGRHDYAQLLSSANNDRTGDGVEGGNAVDLFDERSGVDSLSSSPQLEDECDSSTPPSSTLALVADWIFL